MCGWASWALEADIDFAGFIEYEARLTDFLAATGSRVMCHYLFRRFRAAIIHDVLRTHPLAIVGDHVHDNMYHEPPALILGSPETDPQRVEWMRQRLRARALRDLALANLGRLALAGAAPNELMSSVASFIAAEVEVDLVEISELVTPGDALRVVAAAGRIPPDLDADQSIEKRTPHSRGAASLGQPLVVPDWSEDARFPELRPNTTPPITSSAVVAIGIPSVKPISGFLSVHSVEPRIFSEDELVLLENVATALAHALERRRLEDELRALIEHSPDAIVRVDKSLRIMYVNPTFERLTARRAESLLGAPLDAEGVLQPMFASWDVIVRHVLRSGREQTAEYTLTSPGGERVMQGRIVPEFSPATGREVQSLIIVARDVTELTRALDDRVRLSQELLERERRHQERLEQLLTVEQEDNRRLRRAAVLQELSARERQILRLIAHGRTNAAIGAELHLSTGTVKNHITRLLRKLGAADRAQAAAQAGEIGLTQRPN